MGVINKLKSIDIDEESGVAVFSVNPKIYPLELVYSASYIMIDKAFIILDGDPEKEILVEIRKKEKDQELKELVQNFNEELLNYAVYKTQSEKNKNIRELILQKVLMTNGSGCFSENKKEGVVEDPEGIMKTWEEANKEKDENEN